MSAERRKEQRTTARLAREARARDRERQAAHFAVIMGIEGDGNSITLAPGLEDVNAWTSAGGAGLTGRPATGRRNRKRRRRKSGGGERRRAEELSGEDELSGDESGESNSGSDGDTEDSGCGDDFEANEGDDGDGGGGGTAGVWLSAT